MLTGASRHVARIAVMTPVLLIVVGRIPVGELRALAVRADPLARRAPNAPRVSTRHVLHTRRQVKVATGRFRVSLPYGGEIGRGA